jgi:ATP-dependent RNA helicase DDX52/ROK1
VSKKARAQQLHRELLYDGMHVDSISGDQPNAARAAAVENFRAVKTWVLIATDLIGRGMDFAAVNTVINYDFPVTTTDYIHRVGRTGGWFDHQRVWFESFEVVAAAVTARSLRL